MYDTPPSEKYFVKIQLQKWLPNWT